MTKITIDRAVVEQAIYHLNRAGLPAPWNTAEALRAALEQQDHSEQHLDMVPTGWKLVPEKLTQHMADAAKVVDGRLSVWKYDDAYRAMLAVAPQPPALEQPADEMRARFEAWWDSEEGIDNAGPWQHDTPIQFAWAAWRAALGAKVDA